jgi:uncharacterized protein (DUF1501 family)
MSMFLTRRAALLGLTSAVSLTGVAGRASLALAAAPTDKRFVVVILRGAMDGLTVVPPYGDPALRDLRSELIPALPGQPNGLHDLGGFYGLHPALTNMYAMYQANELLVIHAAAGPYRSRSHFEAQDYLESGADHRLTSGWLNRVVGTLPADRQSPTGLAMAVGVTVPLILRGPTLVGNWAPHGFASPEPDLYARIAALNHGDALTGPAIADGLHARAFAGGVMADGDPAEKEHYAFPALAAAAGRMLAAPDGPRIAAMETNGWDTHVAQMARLDAPLKQLDSGLAALKTAMGPAWRQTAVLVMTEFGRTARVNGDKGTDHGTATVAFALGGAVSGGKVRATWPGLGGGRLFENRDLAPTVDVREVAMGLLTGHLGVARTAIAQVFPGSTADAPMSGLLRA